MVWEGKHLQTRQFVRREVSIPARIELASEHADQIRFAYSDTACRMTVVDISEGGLALRSEVYIPRNARLIVRVSSPGQPGTDTVVTAIVRRCLLLDIRPSYLIGLQFLDVTGSERDALLKLAPCEPGTAPNRQTGSRRTSPSGAPGESHAG